MDKEISSILKLIENDEALIASSDRCVREARHLNVSGLCEQQKGYLIAALANKHSKKPVVISSDTVRAKALAGSMKPFIDGEILIVEPSEMSIVTAVASSRDGESERVGSISRLMRNDYAAAIICAGALASKMQSKKEFEKDMISLKLGDRKDPTDLIDELVAIGYERVASVSCAGEFAARGDVIDVFSPDSRMPTRLSFFDDEIDQIKSFDTDDQRSTESFTKVTFCRAREIVFDAKKRGSAADTILKSAASDINKMNAESAKAAAELLSRTAHNDSDAVREGMRLTGMARWIGAIVSEPDMIIDYIDKTLNMLFIDEMSEVRGRIDGYEADYISRCRNAFETGTCPSCAFESIFEIPEIMKRLDKGHQITAVSCLATSGNGLPGGLTVTSDGLAGENWRGRDKELGIFVKKTEAEMTMRFLLTGSQRVEGFRLRMVGEGVSIKVIPADLPAGFVYPAAKMCLIGEQDVFGSEKKISKKRNGAAKITFFGDITPGDYVVHDAHGIGRYEGIVNMRMGKSNQDYLKISYAKNATIYLPIDKLDKLQKYVGPNGKEPKLSSLDSGEWNKSVERARTSIKKVAFDLVKLYAARRASKGYSCSPDDVWQKEFEENFPYTETDVQLNAIRDIKKDMESDTPMDRLLCGDVGFGKTEVAFRAIFKCVTNGKQAFMLAPTTLLAQQHYDNFLERLHGFPIRVVLLSRFVPAAVMKQNLKDIKEGKADVVIGTHRILSKDVIPHDLGLLVVDEEQRFGVNHKEQIKAMRNNIDVLTLTATPIPRTLHMSMSGIRDISVLDEAPMNRRPVQTYVMGYDEEIVTQACLREISRGGQVFYLYNKTADIDKKAAHLEALMPGVKVSYAHGKMSEHQMEKIIESFIVGEADILVCTTIIESGVDMPNVNTMIVEDSDRFGLSQLYQIKGRVGRSDRQAYAYITYDPDKEMNSDARKRLMAIREFTELGSGVKIALRDLEVRGAGNLLGAEQHGQMDVIGYELYCRLLDEEIKHLKDGDDVSFLPAITVNMEVDFDSYIPVSYIEDEESRMAAYRRIGSIGDRKDYDDFLDEVTDRYGDPPKEVNFLAGAALIRALAAKAGFERVCFKDAGVLLYFASDRKMNMKSVTALIGTPEFAGRILMCAQGKPYLHYKPRTNRHDKTVEESIKMLDILIENMEPKKAEA
ncbi:transcription-repair coupling factor [Ruminococcaceae bacterium KH2T8]|nr:transcription-repair coupling factor [Ruminococcaceae bacterium KH2T8]